MWRLANPGDDDSLVEMCLRLYDEDPGVMPVHPKNMRATLRALRREPCRGRAVVLDIESQLSGYALLIAFWSNELGGDICEVDELFVVPECRNQGHGQALFNAISEGDLWPTPIVGIALGVTPDNVRARRLYERLKFAAVGISMVRRLPQNEFQLGTGPFDIPPFLFGGRLHLSRLKDQRTNSALSGQRVPDEAQQIGPTAFEDQQLAAAVLAKDRKTTAEFVARYAANVQGYIRARLAPRYDQVEDLVQDVFVSKDLGRLREAGSLESWVTRHKLEDYYRQRLRAPESMDDPEHVADVPTFRVSKN